MERFVSDPIELPPRDEHVADYYRADLIFYGVDHSGPSFEGRVYLNAPEVDVSVGRDHPSFAGAFHIFGHGGCFGDEGHCDVPSRADPFDYRPAHQLTPQTKTVQITDALRQANEAGDAHITVTVVAETPGDESNDVLSFDTVRLVTYETGAQD